MTSVSEFIEAIKDSGEVKSAGNVNVTPALRRSLVRALNRLSSVRAPWTEAEFLITTVIDQSEYAPGHPGFPRDAAAFVVAEFDHGAGVYKPLALSGLAEVLRALRLEEYAAGGFWPCLFTWWNGKLRVAPAPTTAATLRGWYHRGARRDLATGNLIDTTAGSDAYTNAWFDDGEDLLWNRTLEIYHLAFAVDPERAAFYSSQYREALSAVTEEWTRRGRPGLQTAWHL